MEESSKPAKMCEHEAKLNQILEMAKKTQAEFKDMPAMKQALEINQEADLGAVESMLVTCPVLCATM